MLLLLTACSLPSSLVRRPENKVTPVGFNNIAPDTVNTGKVEWKAFFTDPYLSQLIDTALQHNQEYNITLQEINIAKNEIRARTGEYQPFLGLGAGGGVEKVGRYTRSGSVEESNEIQPGKRFPSPLPDYMIGLNASWELDIWKKLHNAKKSAMLRYLSSVEGRNFMVTNLIGEIADIIL